MSFLLLFGVHLPLARPFDAVLLVRFYHLLIPTHILLRLPRHLLGALPRGDLHLVREGKAPAVDRFLWFIIKIL